MLSQHKYRTNVNYHTKTIWMPLNFFSSQTTTTQQGRSASTKQKQWTIDMSNSEEEFDTILFDKILCSLKDFKTKGERFISACNQGNDTMSLKLLEHLGNREMTVLDMLYNDECRFLFKEFCQMELSSENIEFWEECQEFNKCTSVEQRWVYALNLYQTYISPHSTKPINIDMSAVKEVKKRLDNFEKNRQVELSDILAPVKTRVEECMSDTFIRFLKDKLYRDRVLAFNEIQYDKIVDKTNNYATLLHLCAKNNKVACMKFLLKKGLDVDCLDGQKSTPLNYALAYRCDEAALFLIKRGARINLNNDNNRFPLTADIKNKYYKIGQLLVQSSMNGRGIKFEDKYTIVSTSDESTRISNIHSSSTMEADPENGSTYLVEDKDTMKRCNAFSITFKNVIHAIQCRNDNWRQYKKLDHENLIPIRDLFVEKDNSGKYKVYIIKVNIFQIDY